MGGQVANVVENDRKKMCFSFPTWATSTNRFEDQIDEGHAVSYFEPVPPPYMSCFDAGQLYHEDSNPSGKSKSPFWLYDFSSRW